jgi:hypothetical protein
MDRTSDQPQVNLSLLRSNSLKSQPIEKVEGGRNRHVVPCNKTRGAHPYGEIFAKLTVAKSSPMRMSWGKFGWSAALMPICTNKVKNGGRDVALLMRFSHVVDEM